MVEEKSIVKKGTFRRMAKKELAKVHGNISSKAIESFCHAIDDFGILAVQSAWIITVGKKRKTILQADAVLGIETAQNLISTEILDSLIFKLTQLKKEVLLNDDSRRKCFEADGRGRKAESSENT